MANRHLGALAVLVTATFAVTGTAGAIGPAAVAGRTAHPFSTAPVTPRASPDPAPTAAPDVQVDLRLPAHPSAADLARVQGLVATLARQASSAAAKVDGEADQEAFLLVQLQQARAEDERAHRKLDDAVRRSYEAGGGNQVIGFLAGVSPVDTEITRQAGAATLQVDSSLVSDSQRSGAAVAALSARADAARTGLLAAAGPVESAESRAEAALDAATKAFAADQAAVAALAAQRAALASTAEQVAFAVTPAVSASGQAAAAAQAPVLALLDRTPPGAVPAGYHRTGKTISGISSWYGPGFVGRGTSSGSPYNPEQLTCAMLAVPLGTLVRVTTAAGGVVTVLVTDHGPYAGVNRVIDLSERAAQVAGVGLTPVSVEVLEPGGAPSG